MKQLCLLPLLILSQLAGAADKKYPVSEIPESLLKGADAVVRLDESKVFVNNPGSVIYKVHTVFTILNSDGDPFAVLRADYDKLNKVSNISGAMYDADGILVQKLKPKDLEDISSTSNINWDDDNRAKVYKFYSTRYPFTIEYSYETAINHTFYLPSWIPQIDEDLAVENSSYEIEFPADFGVRYQTFNISEPVQGAPGDKKTLRWELKDRPAMKVPGYFSSWRDYQTAVFVAPKDFRLGRISGNMETWKNFGLFLNELIKDKNVLPEAVRTRVHELTANATTQKEKVYILYDYLQQHTRYVSIQLGVGGWEPFDAAYVAGKGYGDCKALVNYMRSLLHEAGIEAYYTLVYAGDNNFAKNHLIESFPSNQFNHVILCVPAAADTIWLECTDQHIAAGYMGGFTSNRKALLIKEDGGYIVATPRYNIGENRLTRQTRIQLNNSGSAEIASETAYAGLQQDDLYDMIKSISPEKIKRYLSNTISLASYEIKDFKYEPVASEVPVLKEKLDISAETFANVTGKRIFITPNVFSRSGINMKLDTARQVGFIFNSSYHDSDYTEILLPAGYKIEAAIRPVSISAPFGKYEMSCTLEGNKIIYKRTMEQYETKLPLTEQAKVVDFFKQVYKADRARVVLVSEG